jgi:hypothetical protein
MLATLGVITTEAGFRWPGYISKTLDLKFSDIPGGALDSWAAVPDLGWLQIVAFFSFLELAYGAQDPKKEPGDVGGVSWIRYDDPEVKKFKLNVRRRHPPPPACPNARLSERPPPRAVAHPRARAHVLVRLWRPPTETSACALAG